MRAYEMRRGQGKNLEGDQLRALVADVFGRATVEDGKVVTNFGAIEKLTTWTDGKQLFVDMTMKPGVPDTVATDTITRNNRFLEWATGYTTKQRKQKAEEAAKRGPM